MKTNQPKDMKATVAATSSLRREATLDPYQGTRHGSWVADSSPQPVPTRARRILVADDDEAMRCLLSTVLGGAGFNVNAAADGQEAWETLLREPYDLLVTDNEMPRLTGVKLIERIRAAGMTLPVIIASGTFSTQTFPDYLLRQFAAVLPKPFRIFEILNAVRHIFQAPPRASSPDQRISNRLAAASQPAP